MACHILQHFPFPAKIFHKLTGQLNSIPLNAIDTGDTQLFHLSEQVMQTVSELMEQRDHFVVREEGGFATKW